MSPTTLTLTRNELPDMYANGMSSASTTESEAGSAPAMAAR
ncbi:hypothetical protein BH10ACT3_BH10ACT3_14840 [soil metagenome]